MVCTVHVVFVPINAKEAGKNIQEVLICLFDILTHFQMFTSSVPFYTILSRNLIIGLVVRDLSSDVVSFYLITYEVVLYKFLFCVCQFCDSTQISLLKNFCVYSRD